MKKVKSIALIFVAILLAIAPLGCGEKKYHTSTHTVFSSGIVFSASLLGGNESKALEEMSAMLDEIGESVNTQKSDSFVSRFNRAPAGEVIEVDEHTYFLASEAKRLYLLTGGAFDVTLSSLSEIWGVDIAGINEYAYSGGQPDALPTSEQIISSKGASANSLIITESEGKYYLTKTDANLTLDLGGIAKGYCADKCREIAKANGVTSALISVGGNLVLIGNNENANGSQKEWGVGVNNPRPLNSIRYVCGFYDTDCGIATSGDYERCWDYEYSDGDKVQVCHILDGRKGMPLGVKYNAQTSKYENESDYIISATIRGESSMLCDALATAVCVLGLEQGKALLESVGYDGIIFTADKKCLIVGDFLFEETTNLYKEEYSFV